MPAVRKLAKETSQVYMAYENGATIRIIARAYKVSPGTIRNILIRGGYALRRRGRRKKEEQNA